MSPAARVRWALQGPGIAFRGEVEVAALRPRANDEGTGAGATRPASAETATTTGATWDVLGANGDILVTADAVVIAAGVALPALLSGTRSTPGPSTALPAMQVTRGQISVLAAGTPGLRAPRVPIAGGGYALALPDGRVVFGATTQAGDSDPALRDADHASNLAQLAAVTGSSIGL